MPGSVAYQYNPTGIMQPDYGFPRSPYMSNPYLASSFGSLAPGSSGLGAGAKPTGVVSYYPNVTSTSPATTTPGGAGNLPQNTVGNYSAAFGGKPAVPDPNATAKSAVGGNLANYPAINQLTGEINATNQAAVMGNVEANIPNYTGLIDQRSQNIAANLAGQVPQDVQQLLQTQAAERGVGAGVPGSPAIDYSNLLSLGLTSLGRQDTGAQQLGSALNTVPHVPIADPSSMMVSPADVQAAQYASNVIGAAPDPTTAAETAFQRLLLMRALAEQGANRGTVGAGVPRMPTMPTASPGGYQLPQWLGTGLNLGAGGDTSPAFQGNGASVYNSPFEMSFPEMYGTGDAGSLDAVASPEFGGGWLDTGGPTDYYSYLDPSMGLGQGY